MDDRENQAARSTTEATILDAALEAVTEHGIRRTSAAEIARRSGLARQTLYRYWPDMQALYAALVTRELLALIPPVAPVSTLDGLVAELVETAERIRDLPLMSRLRDTDPELLARYILERLGASQRAIIAALAERFAAGQQAGTVRAGDPQMLAAMVLLIAQSAIQSAPLVQEWLSEKSWRRELTHVLTAYLAPGSRQ